MKSISIYHKTETGQETISLKLIIMGEVWLNNSLFLIIQPPDCLQFDRGSEQDLSLQGYEAQVTLSSTDLIYIIYDYNSNPVATFQENAYYIVCGQIHIDNRDCLVVRPKDTLKNLVLDPQDLLSERELQVVVNVAQGKSNKQIAKKLKISEWTVSTHLRRIFIKLDVDSRAAMVYRCASLIRYRTQQSI